MRFTTTPSFERDIKGLKPEHRRQFALVVLKRFAPACDAWSAATASRSPDVWPKSLRVDELVNTRGLMEMTWSFASPDGRATFRFDRDGEGWICVWRRVVPLS